MSPRHYYVSSVEVIVQATRISALPFDTDDYGIFLPTDADEPVRPDTDPDPDDVPDNPLEPVDEDREPADAQ